MNLILTLLGRDLRLALRRSGTWLLGLVFMVLFVGLCAVAMGGSLSTLRPFAPALIWLAVLLATLLSLGTLYAEDLRSGVFAQMKLAGVSLLPVVLAKFLSFLILGLGPLILAAPLAGVLLGLRSDAAIGLLLSLLIAAPAIASYASICASLLAAERNAGVIGIILTAPFLIPILIFGVGAAEGFAEAGLAAMEFRILAGLSLISAAIAWPASAAALSANLD